METTLHRQLKALYADEDGQCEVRLGDFRIDAVRQGRLIEIQHGSLSAIRRKVERLLEQHEVLVVKPLVARKLLIKMDRRRKKEVSRRYSPKRGDFLQIFEDLVYLARLFPHPRLVIETPLVEIEELRCPRPPRRWRGAAFRTLDQRLVRVVGTRRLASHADLLAVLPPQLPQPFQTGHLAALMGIERWIAQKIAYCLRTSGTAEVLGKNKQGWLYQLLDPKRAAI
jgi:hypothetical protein